MILLVEYKGYYIPEDSTIISSMYSMHRNPDVYPEPDKFNPERFMSNTRSMYSAANGPLENRDHYNFGWGRYVNNTTITYSDKNGSK